MLAQQSILRHDARAIFDAGVAAADPYAAVINHMSFANGRLSIRLDDGSRRGGDWTKVHVIAFGKGASAMARAAEALIPGALWAGKALVVTNYENVAPLANAEVLGAGHPLPDPAGLQAARRLAEKVGAAERGELVLVLASGGGSALLPYPTPPLTLDEKIATTRLLLACGATINEVNCVRKHLSQLKGGGLARLAAPADLHALILSDVLGDDLSAISSGPTVPDPSTFGEAIAILHNRRIWEDVPASVRALLQQGDAGAIPETPKADDPIFRQAAHTLVGSNTMSLNAAADTARRLGYETIIYSDRLAGIARDVAEQWVRIAAERGCDRPIAMLAGGETTVEVKGSGKGGRNQEMALAFVLAAEHAGFTSEWLFLSGGSDGRDGPTDAAGGVVDRMTLARMRAAGLDPRARLDDNDAYHALRAAGDLLMTGATGTNIADLQMLLLRPKT